MRCSTSAPVLRCVQIPCDRYQKQSWDRSYQGNYLSTIIVCFTEQRCKYLAKVINQNFQMLRLSYCCFNPLFITSLMGYARTQETSSGRGALSLSTGSCPATHTGVAMAILSPLLKAAPSSWKTKPFKQDDFLHIGHRCGWIFKSQKLFCHSVRDMYV